MSLAFQSDLELSDNRTSLVVVLAVQDAQNRHEQVQDIQVQRDSSCNLLLNMVVAHNQLRINEDIRREHQRTKHTVDKLEGAVERQENGHEAKEDHEPQRAEQVRHPVGEVVLGLAGEEGQGDEDAECQHEGLHDDPRVVEGCHHADGVCFEERESGEEEEVGGVGLALPVGCEHEAQRAEDGNYH